MKISTTKKQNLVECARSFSFHMNLGNYEGCDFFCSEKAEVPESEVEAKSEQLYRFCRAEVSKSINSFLKEKEPKPIDTDKANEIWDEHRQKLYNMDAQTREEEMNTEAGRLCQHSD